MRTQVISEDRDEMPHNVAFPLGLHGLLRQTDFKEKNSFFSKT